MIRFLSILLTLALAATGFCQFAVQLPNRSAGVLIAGEHFPVIYSGDGLIKGAANTYTSPWFQVGFSPWAVEADNHNIGIFNPEIFTVGVKLSCFGAGDSAQISSAYIDCAFDTTAQPFWNGDSSNKFIETGCFNHDQYGIWRFEALSDTSRRWLYPVRAVVGGYLRLVFESDVEDTCNVDWMMICEH